MALIARRQWLFFLAVALTTSGCEPTATKEDQANKALIPVARDEDALKPTRMISAEEMRKQLGASEQAQFERSGTDYIAAGLGGSGATTIAPLHGQPLRFLDISQTKITDLTPVEGMPLERLILIRTSVTDLSPLSNLPLVMLDASETPVADVSPLATCKQLEEIYFEKAQVKDITPFKQLAPKKLWLSYCPVESLAPIAGKTFEELNLCNVPVQDFSPLATMQIGTLWLRETSLKDLNDIVKIPLVSLDIQGTHVEDLSPLQHMTSLDRLNISQTDVTDLTPLKGLHLTRLIFSPEKIKQGMEVVREMKSLRQLDTSFEGVTPAATPSEFWERFDRSNSKPETPQ